MNRKTVSIAKSSGKSKNSGMYFLGVMLAVYGILFIAEPGHIRRATMASVEILVKILPVLLFVFLFMALLNFWVNPKKIKKYVGAGSGIKGWLLAIIAGVLSHGPIYAWYPLLGDLRDHGMRSGLIATFLYNRAIKIPLLPLMIYYLGFPFVVVLAVFMMLASVLEGQIIEKLNI